VMHQDAGDVWTALSPAELRARSTQRWQRFVDRAGQSATIHIFDGQWFSGDLTGLMLLDEPLPAVHAHHARILTVARPLQPVLIYLRPPEVEHGLRRILGIRGEDWLKTQVDWKVASPYARRRGLSGVEGWLELYRSYRAASDRWFDESPHPKLRIETAPGRWRDIEAEALNFLELPRSSDPPFELWRHLRGAFERVMRPGPVGVGAGVARSGR
jgi:hypothetical protein